MRIPLFKVFMPPREELMPSLESVLYSGMIGEGEQVLAFEKAFGDWIGQANVLSFHSGTAALHVALLLAGAGPGTEVISTAMTAEPTNLAIRYTGADVVWADVDPGNGNIDPASVEAAITERTKAILVVHYGGIPAPMAKIRAIADRRGLPVVEDIAHALGARYDGVPVGRDSDYAMFSFQSIKHLTTVDGGMLAMRGSEQMRRGRRLRWFGMDRGADRMSMEIEEAGFKYHMNNVTAAIGLAQLEHVDAVIDRHIDNGRFYDRALAQHPDLEICRWDAAAEPSYWFYTVLVDRPDDLARALASAGIGSSRAHRRNDEHPIFAGSKRPLPGLDKFWSRMLHIPCGWWVSPEDRAQVVDVLRRGW